VWTNAPSDSVVGYLLQWAHLRPILAMATTWFLYEVLFAIHLLAVTGPMGEAIGVRLGPRGVGARHSHV
jgi:hypothetical protein